MRTVTSSPLANRTTFSSAALFYSRRPHSHSHSHSHYKYYKRKSRLWVWRTAQMGTLNFSTASMVPEKPPICTADELHYVAVPTSDWTLALWRYIPPPQAPPRNHPLFLLSGVGTNAIGYDLAPGMDYIRSQAKPKDGKLLAIGHSMGGILLYAHLSSSARTGKRSGLAAVVTLASSLDYTGSNSSLKLLVPLADPAQALNVPVLPLGTLMAAVYPLASQPPYALSWLNNQVSARDMMHPEHFKKLVLNNFCTVPAKLILQLATAFRPGGLRNRTGSIYYKDSLGKCKTHVLAIAGDKDLICPPEAVQDTAKEFPPDLVTYKLFGGENDVHYAHYDLVGGRLAVEEVYPSILEFLTNQDKFERNDISEKGSKLEDYGFDPL